MAKVKKDFGTFPEDIVVLSTRISFNLEGYAEVEEDAVLAVLEQIPGYTVEQPVVDEVENTEVDSTPLVEAVPEPQPEQEPEPEEPASEVKTVKAPTKRRAQPTKK